MDIRFYVWARPPGNTKSNPVVPIDPLWYNPMFVPLVKVWLGNVNQINGRPPDSERFDTGPTDSIERVVIRLQEWWNYLFGDPTEDDPEQPKTHIYPNENRPVALFLPNFGVRGHGSIVPALMRNDGDALNPDDPNVPPEDAKYGSIYTSAGAIDTGEYTDNLLLEWDASGPKEMRIETLLWDLEQGIANDSLFVSVIGGVPQGWRYWAVNDDRYGEQVVLDGAGAPAPRTFQYIMEQEAHSRFGVNTMRFSDARVGGAPINRPIRRYMATIGSRALDWRLHETLYAKFKEWVFPSNPGVKPWESLTAGNYNIITAHETEPADSLDMRGPWLTRFHPDAFYGDFVLPVLYSVKRINNGQDIYTAWGKAHWSASQFMQWRANRLLNQTAQGNRWHKEVLPYILSPGYEAEDDTGVYFTMTDEDFEILLDMAWSYGARRFAVFTGDLNSTTGVTPIPEKDGKTVWQRIGDAFDALNERTKNPARRRRGRWPNKIE